MEKIINCIKPIQSFCDILDEIEIYYINKSRIASNFDTNWDSFEYLGQKLFFKNKNNNKEVDEDILSIILGKRILLKEYFKIK